MRNIAQQLNTEQSLPDSALRPKEKPENSEIPISVLLGLLSSPPIINLDACKVPGAIYQQLRQLEAVTDAGARARLNSMYGVSSGTYRSIQRPSNAFGKSERLRRTARGYSRPSSSATTTASSDRIPLRPACVRPATARMPNHKASTLPLRRTRPESAAATLYKPASFHGRETVGSLKGSAHHDRPGNATSSMHALDRQLRKGAELRRTASHMAPPSCKLPPHFMTSLQRNTCARGPLCSRAMLPSTMSMWDAVMQQNATLRQRLGLHNAPLQCLLKSESRTSFPRMRCTSFSRRPGTTSWLSTPGPCP